MRTNLVRWKSVVSQVFDKLSMWPLNKVVLRKPVTVVLQKRISERDNGVEKYYG